MTRVAGRLATVFHELTGAPLPVRLRAWDGSQTHRPADAPIVVLRHRRALRRLLWAPGELGLARAYVSGEVDVDGDLSEFLRQMWQLARDARLGPVRLRPRQRLQAVSALARLGVIGPPPRRPRGEARLRGPLHSRRRDRSVIAHHYDLSNDFYALLLDESMAYSSALFTDPGQSLGEAQRAKLDLICAKLGLRPGMRLLDVGCGWGSLILHAAERYGVQATGITLSARQRDLVTERIAERDVSDRVVVQLRDYRDLAADGYDAVASIEMGEHVGDRQYPPYARVLHDALKPGGRLVLQQMSRREDAAPGGGAFIEAYIAADMHMRPLSKTVSVLQAAGFEVCDVQGMREHYVTTVRRWLATFEGRYPEFVALVGPEQARVWRLYLAGGALSFEEGRMGVDQVLARRGAAAP